LYKSLFASKTQIEKELGVGASVEWMELPKKKASCIRVLNPFKFSDESTWNQAFDWLCKTGIQFKKVFTENWTERA
jgi:hypothetical protein